MKKKNQSKNYDDPKIHLFHSISNYAQATIALAKTMANVKSQYGRKTIEEITNFDLPRINILCGLGNLPNRVCEGLLPEVLSELLGQNESDQRKYATQAREKSLKASGLRKIMRENNKTVVSHDKKVKTNDWGKQLLLLENSMKQMDSTTKQRALAHLVNVITTLK